MSLCETCILKDDCPAPECFNAVDVCVWFDDDIDESVRYLLDGDEEESDGT